MAVIEIEAPTGEFVEFEIAGDRPTKSEASAIQDIMNNFRSSRDSTFDTKSGVDNAILRAALSGAETAEEEEAMLARAGFAAEDYTRDSKNRLALTPTGAKKAGIDTNQNILIDEEGFSRYDFTSDLAGIAPELIGGIFGAVKGGTLGTAFGGPVGGLGGAILGAATGAATGNVAEEAVEGLFGVSKQTAGEIVEDTAREAVFAAGAELVFGVPFLAFKALSPSAKIAQEGGEAFERTGEAIARGYQPTKRAMGISPIAAKLEQVSESVIGTSPRQAKNSERMAKDLKQYNDKIRQAFEASQGKIAGDYLLEAQTLASANFRKAEKAARSAVNKQLDDSVTALTGSLRQNKQLDEQLFNAVENSFKAFSEANAQKFALIDDVLNKSIGQANIIPTNSLKELTESFQKQYGDVTLGGADDAARAAANELAEGVSALGNKSSFTALYRNRERLAKAMYANPQKGSTAHQMQKAVVKELDNMLTSSNIESLGKELSSKIGEDSVNALKAASDSIPEARKFYSDGMKAFEKIEAATTGKNLIAALKAGESPARLSGFGTALVKNADKSPLLNLKAAMKNESQYNLLKTEIGKEWMRNALKNSGFDSLNPKNFNSENFLKSIDDLGETGEELFGTQINEIKNIATRLDNLSMGKINSQVLQEALESGINASVVNGLRQSLTAAEEFSKVKKRSLLNKLNDGSLEADEALEVFLAPGAKKKELRAIMNFFERSGNEGAIQTIRGAVLNDILDGIGATVNAQKLGSLSARIAKRDKNQKLDIILGKEAAEDLRSFGRIMKTLSEDASTSDLVANNITVNFMSSIGRISRLFVFGKLFDGSGAVRQIEDAYRASKNLPPVERVKRMDTVIKGVLASGRQSTGQFLEEGVTSAAEKAENLISSASQNLPTVTQPTTASSLSSVNVAQPIPQTGTIAPVSPQLPSDFMKMKPNIRQMATNNPAVAQALGIRGATAGLL